LIKPFLALSVLAVFFSLVSPGRAEVRLNVPFEPNLGNTCFSSSFAMVLRYLGQYVHVQDVLQVVGSPPFAGYDHPELAAWMESAHDLLLVYQPYSSLEQLKLALRLGYPAVVHQLFSLAEATGHNRVVIGYDDGRSVIICNDPSSLGPGYEMAYEEFNFLWTVTTEQGPPHKAYFVIPRHGSK
jgi:hypothetical protein